MATISADGAKGHHKFTLTVVENSTSVNNNTSSLSFTFTLSPIQAAWDWYNWGSHISYSVNIDGNVYSGTIPAYDGYSTVTLQSNSLSIEHNPDGTKEINISFSVTDGAYQNYTPGDARSSGKMTLTTIPRASKLNTMPSTFNVEDGVAVKFTSNSSSFKHKLEVYANSKLVATKTGITSGRTFKFTESELNTIYSTIPSGDGASFIFSLLTYSDDSYSTQIGDFSRQFPYGYLTIVVPTFNNYTYADVNSKTLALTGNKSNVVIHGYSNVKITVPQNYLATANTRGATISHYLFNDIPVNYVSGATSVTDTHNNFDYECILGYAVDTRGTPSLCVAKIFTEDVDYIYYEDITKNSGATATRDNNGGGSQVTISFSGKWWNKKFGPDGVTNTISAEYKYKKSKESNYTNGGSISLTKNENKYSYTGIIKGDQSDNGFDISESYDIIVTVQDELSWAQFKYVLPAGEPAIAVYKNKVAFGGMYNESLGGVQFNGKLYSDDKPLFKREYVYTTLHSLSVNQSYKGEINIPQYDGYTVLCFSNDYTSYGDVNIPRCLYNRYAQKIFFLITINYLEQDGESIDVGVNVVYINNNLL